MEPLFLLSRIIHTHYHKTPILHDRVYLFIDLTVRGITSRGVEKCQCRVHDQKLYQWLGAKLSATH